VCGRHVQPTLEQAESSGRTVRVAGSLKSGLASAPDLDPESASSSSKGLRLDGLVILCWPAAVCGEESAVVQIVTPRLTDLERLLGPSAPRLVTPDLESDVAPRTLLRAEPR
jgi:hypothetical protein